VLPTVQIYISAYLPPLPTLPYPTLPYPTRPYPTRPYPTLPYPTLPYPTPPYPTLPAYPPTCPIFIWSVFAKIWGGRGEKTGRTVGVGWTWRLLEEVRVFSVAVLVENYVSFMAPNLFTCKSFCRAFLFGAVQNVVKVSQAFLPLQGTIVLWRKHERNQAGDWLTRCGEVLYFKVSKAVLHSVWMLHTPPCLKTLHGRHRQCDVNTF
jgi:hypothetical protein